jgi:hypothetical protein
MEEVNLATIYSKNFCKCHNVPLVKNNMIIKKLRKKKKHGNFKEFSQYYLYITICLLIFGISFIILVNISKFLK